MTEKPFQLNVIPRSNRDYGLAIDQQSVSKNGNHRKPQRIVQIWGLPLQLATDLLLETLKKSGYRANQLSRSRKAPFEFNEETGVRLGLLFLAIKPLSKIQRIETITAAIRSMPSEEAYYWFSKCTTKGYARRAQKALRILLSRE